jgi:hypothetical protein
MKVGLIPLSFALLASVSVGRVPPPGLQAIDVSIDDTDDNWPMTVGDDSPWGSRVETDDMLIGWSERNNRAFQLRWHNNLDDLSDFLCDHLGKRVYIWVENFRNDEGYVLRVPVGNDPDGLC